jgi:hypothetical protein
MKIPILKTTRMKKGSLIRSRRLLHPAVEADANNSAVALKRLRPEEFIKIFDRRG